MTAAANESASAPVARADHGGRLTCVVAQAGELERFDVIEAGSHGYSDRRTIAGHVRAAARGHHGNDIDDDDCARQPRRDGRAPEGWRRRRGRRRPRPARHTRRPTTRPSGMPISNPTACEHGRLHRDRHRTPAGAGSPTSSAPRDRARAGEPPSRAGIPTPSTPMNASTAPRIQGICVELIELVPLRAGRPRYRGPTEVAGESLGDSRLRLPTSAPGFHRTSKSTDERSPVPLSDSSPVPVRIAPSATDWTSLSVPNVGRTTRPTTRKRRGLRGPRSRR